LSAGNVSVAWIFAVRQGTEHAVLAILHFAFWFAWWVDQVSEPVVLIPLRVVVVGFVLVPLILPVLPVLVPLGRFVPLGHVLTHLVHGLVPVVTPGSGVLFPLFAPLFPLGSSLVPVAAPGVSGVHSWLRSILFISWLGSGATLSGNESN